MYLSTKEEARPELNVSTNDNDIMYSLQPTPFKRLAGVGFGLRLG